MYIFMIYIFNNNNATVRACEGARAHRTGNWVAIGLPSEVYISVSLHDFNCLLKCT